MSRKKLPEKGFPDPQGASAGRGTDRFTDRFKDRLTGEFTDQFTRRFAWLLQISLYTGAFLLIFALSFLHGQKPLNSVQNSQRSAGVQSSSQLPATANPFVHEWQATSENSNNAKAAGQTLTHKPPLDNGGVEHPSAPTSAKAGPGGVQQPATQQSATQQPIIKQSATQQSTTQKSGRQLPGKQASNSLPNKNAPAKTSLYEAKHFASPVQGEILRPVGNYYDEGLKAYLFNPGTDYAEPEGTVIRTAKAGTVVYAGSDPILGGKVTIDCGDQWSVTYGGLENLRVHKGEHVGKDVALGQVAFKSDPEGQGRPLLHYEVRHGDSVINPDSQTNGSGR